MNIEEFANSFSKTKESVSVDLREFLEKQPYWKQDFRTIFEFRLKSKETIDLPKGIVEGSSTQEIYIRADEDAFYIKGNKVLEWTDEHEESDGIFFYENSNGLKFAFDESVILFAMADLLGAIDSCDNSERKTTIENGVQVEELQRLALFHTVQAFWKDTLAMEEWVQVYNVPFITYEYSDYADRVAGCMRLSDSRVADQKTQMVVDESGIYIGENKKKFVDWENYILCDLDNTGLRLIPKERILSILQGSEKIDTLKIESLLILTDGIRKGIVSYYFGPVESGDGRNWEDLDIEDYESSGKVESEKFIYKKDGKLKNSTIHLQYGTCFDLSHSVGLVNVINFLAKEDCQVFRAPLPGFDRHPLKIYYTKDEFFTLEEPYFHKENDEEPGAGFALDVYKLSRKKLRRIAAASILKIVLTGDDTSWDFKAKNLIEYAREFESKISPQYLIDYYDAENAYEDGDINMAVDKIKSALIAKPDNLFFQQLNTKIQSSINKAKNDEVKNSKEQIDPKKILGSTNNVKEEKNVKPAGQTEHKKKSRSWIWTVAVFVVWVFFHLCDDDKQEKSSSMNDSTESVPVQIEQSQVENPQIDGPSIQSQESEDIAPNAIGESENEIIDDLTSVEDDPEVAVIEQTRCYKGTIDGKYAITADLYMNESSSRGSYYYDKYGPDNRLTLRGAYEKLPGSGDTYVLEEYNANGTQIGVFRVDEERSDNEHIEGIYINLASGKDMPFVLTLQN